MDKCDIVKCTREGTAVVTRIDEHTAHVECLQIDDTMSIDHGFRASLASSWIAGHCAMVNPGGITLEDL